MTLPYPTCRALKVMISDIMCGILITVLAQLSYYTLRSSRVGKACVYFIVNPQL